MKMMKQTLPTDILYKGILRN